MSYSLDNFCSDGRDLMAKQNNHEGRDRNPGCIEGGQRAIHVSRGDDPGIGDQERPTRSKCARTLPQAPDGTGAADHAGTKLQVEARERITHGGVGSERGLNWRSPQ